MHAIRRIHLSAGLFLGILLAFALPFGHVVESCGYAAVDPTGVDLLLYDVEPGRTDGAPVTEEDRAFAEEVENKAGPFAWIVALIALAGLALAVFRGGRRWGLCCGGALLATPALGLALEAETFDVGYELVLGLAATGVTARLFLAIARRVHERHAARTRFSRGGRPESAAPSADA